MVERRGYEARDATLRPLVFFLGGLAVLCAVIFAAMIFLFELFQSTAEDSREPSRAVSSVAAGRVLPEPPRLQVDETADLATFRAHEAEIAGQYGWVDKSKGIVRIPIDRARALVVERGLPTRRDPPPPTPTGETP